MVVSLYHSLLAYKKGLALVRIFLFILIFKRIFYSTIYTAGNVGILVAFHELNDVNRQTILSQAESYLLQVIPHALPNQAPLWHLARINLLLEQYTVAANWMQLAKLHERPDFLLTSQNADYYILDGILSGQSDSWQTAMDAYRTAIALEPQEWNPQLYQHYYNALMYLKQPKYQSVISLILATLSSPSKDFRVQTDIQEDMTDWLSIAEGVQGHECWNLRQIQYHPPALELGPLVLVILEWSNIKDGGTYRESKILANLVPNGGFEWGTTENGQPIGYPRTMYDEDNPAENHHLVIMETALSHSSTVALLENSPTFYNSSFVTHPINATSNNLYLQGGWLREDQGNGNLGVGWYGRLPNVQNPYSFLKTSYTSMEWVFYGAIVTLPDEIRSVDLVLTNYNSEGRAYFDDLFLFEIEPPAC